jgi:hypothetical protein
MILAAVIVSLAACAFAWAAIIVGARADDRQPGLRDSEDQVQAEYLRRWRA